MIFIFPCVHINIIKYMDGIKEEKRHQYGNKYLLKVELSCKIYLIIKRRSDAAVVEPNYFMSFLAGDRRNGNNRKLLQIIVRLTAVE